MRTVVLCLVWLLPAVAFAGENDRTFKAWQVTCGVDGYCSATASRNLAPGGAALALVIGRHAERSYWEVALDTTAAPGDDWSDFVVSVDGNGQTFSGRSEIGAYGTPGTFYFLGDKAQVLLDQLVPGTEVRVDFNDKAGAAQSAKFELSGLSAALLYIDETQKRLGSERVAFEPPYGLTPAGNEQVSTPNLPPLLLDRHAADPECEPLQDLANGRDIAMADLGEGKTLYVMPCWSGAYNFGSKLYVGQNSGAGEEFEQLVFAAFSDTLGWSGTTTLVNVSYDETDKTLQTFNKGRGIGDCGSTGLWQWAEYGFRMLEFRYKGACDAEIDDGGELEEFPLVYSAEPQPTPAERSVNAPPMAKPAAGRA